MTRCPSCNATAAVDARFCSMCGAHLSQDLSMLANQPAPTDAREKGSDLRVFSRAFADRKAHSRLSLMIGLLAGLGLMTIVALVLGFALITRDNRAAASTAAVAEPTTPATTTPRATAAPRTTVAAIAAFDTTLLHDTFDRADDSSLIEGENDTVGYAFVNGTYAITLKQPNYIVWSPFEGSYTNASVEVDVTLAGSKANAAGLIFRYQDDQNFYTFLISNDERYELELYHQDTLTTLIDWTESSAIKRPGVANHLRVETTGDRIRLFVNNKLLDEISDDSFGKGQMALAATTFGTSNVTVAFDNLVVRGAK